MSEHIRVESGTADSGLDGSDWQEVDSRLRSLARRAASHDYEIGCLLLRARQTGAHERLGFASLFQYVERLFGFSHRVIAERLRVAEALGDLPETARALREGRLSWSAVRELTRVAVSETESEWLAFAHAKTVRELEQAVSGLIAGDRPGDPPDPHLQRRVVRVELSAEGWALFKDTMARLRRELDPRLSEEDAFMVLCQRAIGSAADASAAPYQVALTVCEGCGRTWQDAGGESIELPPEVGEQAACDAQCLPVRVEGQPGETSGPASTHVGAPRAKQTIPPATRRLVHRRDKGRCRVVGCSNHTWLHVHHLTPRAEGGSHNPSNLLLICSVHHSWHHRGLLVIEGETEQAARFSHADGTVYGEAPRPAAVQANTAAHAALRSLGFTETESRDALAAARAHVGVAASTEELITAALRARQAIARAA
jgi:hypothetical protein